ncbi:hypothetical protein YC2023_064132 [Brassica napus]
MGSYGEVKNCDLQEKVRSFASYSSETRDPLIASASLPLTKHIPFPIQSDVASASRINHK